MATRHGTAAVGQSVGEVAAHTREAISEAVEHGSEHAGEMYQKAKEHAGHWYDQASHRLHDWKDQGVHQIHVVRGTVREHALMSTLIAFGVGFILARLFFRRT